PPIRSYSPPSHGSPPFWGLSSASSGLAESRSFLSWSRVCCCLFSGCLAAGFLAAQPASTTTSTKTRRIVRLYHRTLRHPGMQRALVLVVLATCSPEHREPARVNPPPPAPATPAKARRTTEADALVDRAVCALRPVDPKRWVGRWDGSRPF